MNLQEELNEILEYQIETIIRRETTYEFEIIDTSLKNIDGKQFITRTNTVYKIIEHQLTSKFNSIRKELIDRDDFQYEMVDTILTAMEFILSFIEEHKEKRIFTLDHNVLGILDSTNSLRSIDYRVSNAFGNGKLVDPYLLSSIHSDNGFTSSLSHSDSTVLVSLNSKKEPVYTYWGKHFNPENFIKSTDTTAMGYFKNRQKNIELYSYGKSMVLKPKNGIALQIRFLFLPKMLAPQSDAKYTTHPVRILVQDSLGNPLPHFDLPGNTHFNFEKWYTNGQSIGHLNFLTPMNSETRMVYLEVFTPVVY